MTQFNNELYAGFLPEAGDARFEGKRGFYPAMTAEEYRALPLPMKCATWDARVQYVIFDSFFGDYGISGKVEVHAENAFKAAFAGISQKTARSGTTERGGFSRLTARQIASRSYALLFDAGKELFTMSDRRTAFDAITKDKPTLAGFLRSLPCIEAPWDAAFQKRYCSSCTAENCDACANEQFRNNPEWWLSLPAAEVEQ